ncbi:MAG TPA: NAD(P)-dependent oxidoreductase, partial [Pseudoflavonifractor sp.]|nr:NAD(P)-dependent oxidoreductase [Pseudoflavonifractor sp.]
AGTIAGAGLDVLEHEPPGESPLLKLEQVICTPHIAAYDDVTLLAMVDRCVQSLTDFFTNIDMG